MRFRASSVTKTDICNHGEAERHNKQIKPFAFAHWDVKFLKPLTFGAIFNNTNLVPNRVEFLSIMKQSN